MSKNRKQARVAHAAMTAERIIAVQERRASGGHGTHGDRRLKRQRTRAAAKAAAFRDA